MQRHWVWLTMAVAWLILAFLVMVFVARPIPAKTGPVGSIHASLIRPQTEDWFSAYPAGHRLIHGQEPVEPEGNPNHDPDKMECANVAHEGKMIACQCHKWKTCDEPPDTEHKSCQNWCWAKQKCHCSTTCD